MMNPEAVAACHALLAYLWNTSGTKYAREVYGPDEHPTYLDEKAGLYGVSQVRAIGALDDEHFARLVGLAWEKYGEQSMARFQDQP